MGQYDELRAVYLEAKAEADRLHAEWVIANAVARVAERRAHAEWRKLTDPERMKSLTNTALSSQE